MATIIYHHRSRVDHRGAHGGQTARSFSARRFATDANPIAKIAYNLYKEDF